MKTMPSFLSMTTLVLVGVAVIGCSGGDDVYVRESNPTESSSSALECVVTPGADMCNRTIEDVPDAEQARVVSALQAIADFAAVTDRTLDSLRETCKAMVLETTAKLPSIPQGSTPEESVTRHCSAAADAIIEGGGRGMLTVAVDTPSCPVKAPTPAGCSQVVVLPSASLPCPSASVTVVPGTAATSSAIAVARALERHYATVLTFKEDLDTLARTTATITENGDAYSMLPATCITSATTLATKSSHRLNAVAAARALLANATEAVSH